MSKKVKKKIPGYYLLLVTFIFFIIFFFVSISTVLNNYVNYNIKGFKTQNTIVGNIDNHISDINNKNLIISINKISDHEKQSFYLKTFDPQNKKSNNVIINKFIFNPVHNYSPYIIGSYKDLIWIYNKGLNAYDIKNLKQIYSNLDILKQNSFLKKIFEKKSTKYKMLNHIIYINDEPNVYSFNPDTFIAKINRTINFDSIDNKNALFDTNSDKNLTLPNFKYTEISLEGDISKKLYLRKNTKKGKFDQKIKTNLSFQNGKFLMDTTDSKLIESKNPDSIVIIHDDKMTNQGNHFTISVVSLEGVLQWIMFQSDIGLISNNETSKVIIDSSHLNKNNQLIILTRNPEAAIAFDMKNGSIIWQY